MAQRAFDLAFNSLLITSLQVDDGIGKYPMDTFQPKGSLCPFVTRR